VFEYVYFARPDSCCGAATSTPWRKALGRELAREHPIEADVVIPLPDSGTRRGPWLFGAVGTRYEMGLIRNHYVGRTFIEPKQGIRHSASR